MLENNLKQINKLGYNWSLKNKIDGNYEITIVHKDLPSMLMGLETLSFQNTHLENCIYEALEYAQVTGDEEAKKLLKEFSIN